MVRGRRELTHTHACTHTHVYMYMYTVDWEIFALTQIFVTFNFRRSSPLTKFKHGENLTRHYGLHGALAHVFLELKSSQNAVLFRLRCVDQRTLQSRNGEWS